MDAQKVEGAQALGLTGGIGSGKSTAASIFEDFGATVISADRIGHEVLGANDVRAELSEVFGDDVLAGDGSVDRRALGARVFGDASALEQLNSIVHPRLLSLLRERMDAGRRVPDATGVVVDAALITEWGIEGWFDMVLVVSAPEPLVRERLRARGLSDEEIERRVASQLPLERRLERADEHVLNDGSRVELARELARVWRRLLQIRER